MHGCMCVGVSIDWTRLSQQKQGAYAYLGGLPSLIEGRALMRVIAGFCGNRNEAVFRDDAAAVMLHFNMSMEVSETVSPPRGIK